MKNFNNILISVLALSLISRLISIYFYGDTHVDNEWGIILANLEKHGVLGYHEHEGVVFPTIYTPPLYPYFLYSIKIFFSDQSLFLKTVLHLQVIISLISIYLIFKILEKMFSKTISLFGTAIFSFYPLNVYSVSQISSITLQVFFIILFFFTLMNYLNKVSSKRLFIFSLVSTVLILLRGEFFIIYFLTLSFIFLRKKQVKPIFVSFLITLLFLSPYLIRNYNIFNVITITKSSGYNLWRGNHLNANVEGNQKHSLELKRKVENIKPSIKYDLDLDNLYLKEALKNIKENPGYFLKLYFKKVLSFLFIDINSTYENYYNYLNILPKILISITTLLGIFLLTKKETFLIYYAFYYFFNIFLFSLFFILPRYSLMLLPIQIFLTCYLIKKIRVYLKYDN